MIYRNEDGSIYKVNIDPRTKTVKENDAEISEVLNYLLQKTKSLPLTVLPEPNQGETVIKS